MPFGLPCSSNMLVVALYKILVLDEHSAQFNIDTSMIYQQSYVDNLSYSTENESSLIDAYSEIPQIFRPYNFMLQQYATNSSSLQQKVDEEYQESTPDVVNLLGMQWNRVEDSISCKPIELNPAADTTRKALSSLAENYDPMGYSFPLLNRARLFINELQNDSAISWDAKFSKSRQKTWVNICNQVNKSPCIEIPCHIGSYDNMFIVHCFTDASKSMYGYVVYFENVQTKKWNFVLSKGRVISNQLAKKSIPALECHALCHGIEKTIDLVDNLSDSKLIKPLNISRITIWTDSMVSLSWLDQFTDNRGKLNSKLNVFVLNRLSKVEDLTKNHKVTVKFIAGLSNPSDNCTRAMSHHRLTMSNFFTGPDIADTSDCSIGLEVKLPKHHLNDEVDRVTAMTVTPNEGKINAKHLVPLERFSSLDKLIKTWTYVLKFIGVCNQDQLWSTALRYLIRIDQQIHFQEIFNFLNSPSPKLKDVPSQMKQLNIYKDKEGLLRVAGKFGKLNDGERNPIILARNSILTMLIVRKIHAKLSHAGTFTVTAELRKYYFVNSVQSLVKSILQSCIHCRRFNARAIKLNQSEYRKFRSDPPAVPFKSVFIDFFGHYEVIMNKNRCKIWILIITCLWSRAVNLKIVHGMDVKSLLLAFQTHVNEYGLPEVVISDMGSSIVPSGNIIMNFVNDVETQSYFNSNDIKSISFEQFYKGNSSLGSVVEICVKMSKRLICGSIKNRIVEYSEFEYVIGLAISCINKRPIAFKEQLSENSANLDCISPEMLIRGTDVKTINVIPGLHDARAVDDYQMSHNELNRNFAKLCKVRKDLIDIYEREFLKNLLSQAIDKKQRFTPVKHDRLHVGDIVLIKDNFVKPQKFELGIVRELQVNNLNEVTGAIVFKGSTRELLRRHSSTLIRLLSCGNENITANSETASSAVESSDDSSFDSHRHGSKRKAANECIALNKELASNDLV